MYTPAIWIKFWRPRSYVYKDGTSLEGEAASSLAGEEDFRGSGHWDLEEGEGAAGSAPGGETKKEVVLLDGWEEVGVEKGVGGSMPREGS